MIINRPIHYSAQALAAIEKARRIAAARKAPVYTHGTNAAIDDLIRHMEAERGADTEPRDVSFSDFEERVFGCITESRRKRCF